MCPSRSSPSLRKEDAGSSCSNSGSFLGGERGCFHWGGGSAQASSKSGFPELENQKEFFKDNIFIPVKALQLNVCIWLPADERICKLRSLVAVKRRRLVLANREGLVYLAKHPSRAPSCTSCGR